MRRVPRMTPTAPPSTPIRNSKHDGRVNSADRLLADGPAGQVDAVPGQDRRDRDQQKLGRQRPSSSAPTTVSRIEGGVIQATIRRSTRPSRACR